MQWAQLWESGSCTDAVAAFLAAVERVRGQEDSEAEADAEEDGREGGAAMKGGIQAKDVRQLGGQLAAVYSAGVLCMVDEGLLLKLMAVLGRYVTAGQSTCLNRGDDVRGLWRL